MGANQCDFHIHVNNSCVVVDPEGGEQKYSDPGENDEDARGRFGDRNRDGFHFGFQSWNWSWCRSGLWWNYALGKTRQLKNNAMSDYYSDPKTLSATLQLASHDYLKAFFVCLLP